MIALKVNGALHHVDAEPDTPLLYVLRNDLGLRGTMFGCGTGSCGACLVLIDDRATPACDTPLWVAEGKAVTTIEGLALNGLSPMQQAFVDEQAGQCGYCIAGIIIGATALLHGNPDPSDREVREALDRNLCRCGSHTRIVSAVLKAAEKLRDVVP